MGPQCGAAAAPSQAGTTPAWAREQRPLRPAPVDVWVGAPQAVPPQLLLLPLACRRGAGGAAQPGAGVAGSGGGGRRRGLAAEGRALGACPGPLSAARHRGCGAQPGSRHRAGAGCRVALGRVDRARQVAATGRAPALNFQARSGPNPAAAARSVPAGEAASGGGGRCLAFPPSTSGPARAASLPSSCAYSVGELSGARKGHDLVSLHRRSL